MAYPAVLVFFVALQLLICGNLFHIIQAAQKHSGLSVRLIHRHFSESPLNRANLTKEDRMKELVQLSNIRIESLASVLGRSTNSSSKSSPCLETTIQPTMSSQPFLYYVQVGIGTFGSDPPYKTNYLMVDTGSTFIWTQCEGCKRCFHQVDPYFPKSQSRSYKQFECSRCPPSTKCQDGRCMFSQTYGGGATVDALAAKEEFTFESNGDKHVGIINVFFGCGVNMQNFDEDFIPNNKITGILGLSYGGYSFVRQTRKFLQGRFSYCLQPIDNNNQHGSSSPMFLRFGDEVVQTPGMLNTPLPKQKNLNSYYLNLQGISVATQKLDIPREAFQVKEDGTRGCVIDSGSSISYLVTEAYQVFAAAITLFIESRNPNLRKMNPELGYQLCFERFQEPPQITLPSVTFHFENADFIVEGTYAFYIGNTESGAGMVCSTIFESRFPFTLFGASHQVNHRIIYDTEKGVLFFKGEDCSMGN